MKEQYNAYETADIRVLMMGAARVGKTSILAAMTDPDCLSLATAGTSLEIIPDPCEAFDIARTDMRSFFDPNGTDDPSDPTSRKRNKYSSLVLNTHPTSSWEYTGLTLGLKNKNKVKTSKHKIALEDIPGEWINKFGEGLSDANMADLKGLVSAADVIFITIDSVLLMEDNHNYARTGNRIDNIIKLIKTCCRPSDTAKENSRDKLIIFVPVKCEKYYKDQLRIRAKGADEDTGLMAKLMQRIKIEYNDIIAYANEPDNCKYFTIAIAPVLTLGNIEFKMYRAGGADERNARDMRFQYDQHFYVAETGKPVPSMNTIPPFDPKYCNMPLIYMLLFELAKIKKYQNASGSFLRKIGALFDRIRGMAQDKDFLTQIELLRNNLLNDGTDYISEVIMDSIGMGKN